MALTPAGLTLVPGAVLPFRAEVRNATDTRVSWSTTAAASLTEGRFVAAAPGDFVVRATSMADPSAFAEAKVTVVPSFRGGDALVSNSGGVASVTRTHAIWCGRPEDFPPDAKGAIERALSGLAGSSYLAVVDEYLGGARGVTSFAESIDVPDGCGLTAPPMSSADIWEQACALVRPGSGPDDVYFFYVPFAALPPNACGWHDWVSCSSGRALVAVVASSGTSSSGCTQRAQACNTMSGAADAIVSTTMHELFETITDPIPMTGWSDGSGREISDKCERLGGFCVALGDELFELPLQYSNARHGCVAKP